MYYVDPHDHLDEEFPLGDGTADTVTTVECPYCAAAVTIGLDPGGGAAQEYIEDCQVCCQPWSVSVRYGDGGRASVAVSPID